MAIVTGAISFVSPVYSATCSSREVGLVEDLALPLLDGRDARGQDQRVPLQQRHRRRCPTMVLPAPQGSTITPLPPRTSPPAK